MSIERDRFVRAIAAFDAPWRSRLLGLLAGSAALMAFNIVRIVSLYVIGERWRQLFETFHLAVWQTVIGGATVALFYVWTTRAHAAQRA